MERSSHSHKLTALLRVSLVDYVFDVLSLAFLSIKCQNDEKEKNNKTLKLRVAVVAFSYLGA